ncbi:uncharacterized protein M421DRAFT_421262 [Didymella exigua CBS 183.55]|uniref:Uncharacterized protein n=1 Tax=Didymella exigua CBS 183.55 TaxID=1150837 RepID=A0A6A5RJT2_9PLEO|nr:uncharacterized protein M421DRAFT_421262 [Didymella exigua CBS 183.55]KAF1928082.1 hypothetical protein M421DRAFT_421262 [Didymella exigua CBS 183.55]
MAREFAVFSSIAEGLDVHQIFGAAGDDILDAGINAAALGVYLSTIRARTAVELTTMITGADISTPSPGEEVANPMTAAYKRVCNGEDNGSTPIETPIVVSHGPSPDTKYTRDPTSTSLVWNMSPPDCSRFPLCPGRALRSPLLERWSIWPLLSFDIEIHDAILISQSTSRDDL